MEKEKEEEEEEEKKEEKEEKKEEKPPWYHCPVLTRMSCRFLQMTHTQLSCDMVMSVSI